MQSSDQDNRELVLFMPTTRWRTIKSIFHTAMERPADERGDYLAAACGADAALRAEVDSLLSHHAADDGFIEPPAPGSVAKAFENAETHARIGHRVGAYELLRLLGAGGMGHVYLARRADGQYDKLVAIKLIRRAVEHEELRKRFQNEQKALAALDHPNIARLLDGGVTADGHSYLVMEYIEGKPIDEYCDEEGLVVEKRLEIFRSVCAAVHYAHQRLVIHRDLKPANILVTADGTPKLLDFGIAKLLDEASSEAAPQTMGLSVPFLTPEYASPEQIRGEAITTASDIYALGVILYELLTGRRPYRVTSRAQHELARQICTVEPARPSTAVGEIGETCDVAPPKVDPRATRSNGRPRGPATESLRRRLSGDLDTICLMALRKEAGRRYGSVEQFGEDIRRHLVGLPVIARKDTFVYRTAKFVKRNRAVVLASAVVALALVGGIIGTGVSLVFVQRAQQKSVLMNDFLKQMLAEADINNVGRDLTVREMLDRASERVGLDFSDHPDVEAGLRAAIGKAYLSLRLPDAGDHLQKAYELRKSIHGEMHSDVADSLHDLAIFHYNQGQPDKAEELARQSLAIQESLSGEISEAYASTLDDLAVFVRTTGDYDRAEPIYKKALALNRHLYGPTSPNTGQTLNNYAVLLKLKGDFDRAEEMYREAVEIRRKQPGAHYVLATTLNNLAALLHARGDFRKAEPIYREALALQRRLVGEESPAAALTENNLGMLLLSLARFEEAEKLLRHSLAAHRNRLGDSHPQVATCLFNLGSLYHQLARYGEAEPLYRQSYDIRLQALGLEHSDVATSLTGLGSLAIDFERFEEADRYLTQSLEIRRKLFPQGHAVTAFSFDQLARLERARGNLESAETFARDALALREKMLHPYHPECAASMVRLATVLIDRGQSDQGQALLTEALDRQRQWYKPDHPAFLTTYAELGRAQIGRDPEAAQANLHRALDIGLQAFGESHPEVERVKQLLGRVGKAS